MGSWVGGARFCAPLRTVRVDGVAALILLRSAIMRMVMPVRFVWHAKPGAAGTPADVRVGGPFFGLCGLPVATTANAALVGNGEIIIIPGTSGAFRTTFVGSG